MLHSVLLAVRSDGSATVTMPEWSNTSGGRLTWHPTATFASTMAANAFSQALWAALQSSPHYRAAIARLPTQPPRNAAGARR